MASLKFDFSVDKKDAVKTWTFKDLRVPLTTDASGRDVRVNYDLDAIDGAIYNMFLFLNGERIIRPDFGNSLYKFLYEPVLPTTALRIRREIYTMFEKWEPRVSLLDVQVIPYPDQNTYNCIVVYVVPALADKMPQGGLKFEFTANARRS